MFAQIVLVLSFLCSAIVYNIQLSWLYLFLFQSEVLQKLSLMQRLVISTGGGAVVRSINWYMINIYDSFSFTLSKFSVLSFHCIHVPCICNVRKFMHKGVSVWLDVPVEALARRIAAVGTDSRPLLHYEAEDAYTRVSIFSSTQAVYCFYDK